MIVQRCTHGHQDLILLDASDVEALRGGNCFDEMGVYVTHRWYFMGSLLDRSMQFLLYVIGFLRDRPFWSIRAGFDLIVLNRLPELNFPSFGFKYKWFELHFFEWPRHIECEVCRMMIKARAQREAIPTNPTQ